MKQVRRGKEFYAVTSTTGDSMEVQGWRVNREFAVTVPVPNSGYGEGVWALTHLPSGGSILNAADGERLAYLADQLLVRYPGLWSFPAPWTVKGYWEAMKWARSTFGICESNVDGLFLREQWAP